MKLHIAAVLVAAFALSGCISPRQAAAPSRDNPSGTIEMFKLYARQNDPAGEWDILSPGLKQRFSQQVGRQIGVDDYMLMRRQNRSDPRVKAAETMLQTAIVRQTTPTGPDSASVFVQTSGGPLARSATLGMVRLTKWELRVRSQTEPYWGFTSDPLFGVDRQPDGSYVVWYRSSPSEPRSDQVVPASDVIGFNTTSQWYVDDLGGLESQFVQ